MITFTSVMSSLLVIAVAIFVMQIATELDKELNACGTGVFKDGKCQCISPYTGTHCELVDCGFGELIDSQFLIDSITTPRYENERKIIPGCKCDFKFWGYNCANCTTSSGGSFTSECKGLCKDGYYGPRCSILCKESDGEDAHGVLHEEAGGVFNFFKETPGGEPSGLCQYDGSVKCRDGRAGPNCQYVCKDCVYGSCNLDDGTCDCFDGYYGEFCEKTCPGRCSGKNGVCQPDGNCKCEPGFTGDDCSLECCVRNFGTDIGRVHGECNRTAGGCVCDPGWSGEECDCNAEVTCSGRGVCSAGKCVCSPDFQGARCEMCNDTRVGPFCQYDRYQCPSMERVNGEFVAVNTHGDYACKCNAGFMGENCEMCTPSAYPKSGPVMCTYIVPASLCNRGQVKDSFAGSGVMCDCELNFNSEVDCQNCKTKYFGPDCDIFCDVQCSNSGGTCVNYPIPGCSCPAGKTNVGGVCVVCGGDAECVHGECFRGRCQCDPGYYGDDCNTSAPIFKGKVCNGYTPVLKFETATCETTTDCTSTESESLANRQVAYRAQQYERDMFCHRLDTPLELKDESGCCVDSDFDGRCDEDMLKDQVCSSGELVVDICNERVLEGEVNVFEWCLSQERGCVKNGECVDPDLCKDRCDSGLAPEIWVGKWERDHIESMASLMSETWKFPVTFPDPYNFRKSYVYDNPCPPSHPYLNIYGDLYWCYESLPSSGPCSMYNSGIAPPKGGSWGSNQPECVLNGTSFAERVSKSVDLSFGFAEVEACVGDTVKVIWSGTHNIQETETADCDSADISTQITPYHSDGYEETFEGELTASPGQTRYFKCDSHCAPSGARFVVTCPESMTSAYVPPSSEVTDADINDICVSGADYDTCRDYLIPDTRVFNMTHMYVDGWKPLPTFETCEFGRYLFATEVNGTKTVTLEEPMYAGRIEVISDPRMSAAFARYQNGNESYPDANGDADTMIDSITFFGKGKVEVVVYNYTTEECADFIRKSAYHFENCKRIQFYELDYSWSAFCEWRLTVSVSGGFDKRCYDQSKVCAGCEDYQEGCEGLPLKSEYPAPMPFPCNTYWDDFCDTYLNETAKQTGYCAYAECECDGYAVGGDACNLQCPVPQFTGTEAPCGEDMDPPWGKCNSHIGAIAFGFEQGECDCYNGGSPSVGCAQVCEGEQDCSPDIDTPFSFVTFNCSDIADVQSIEVLSETEQRCHVNLRDSVCNYWRGRCECATPFTVFTKLEEPMYFNEGSYRIALMQGYEIDEYAPFVKYVAPEESILRLMKRNSLCADEFIYPAEDGLVCADTGTKKKNTDWTEDSDGKRCKDYTESDCRTVTLMKEDAYCRSTGDYLAAGNFPDRLATSDPLYDPDGAIECMNRCLAEWPDTQGIYVTQNSGKCGQCKHTCDEFTDGPYNAYKISSIRYSDKIPSSVACEENNQYDLEDMTKEECLAFRSFESSTSVSDSDASDVYDNGYEFKTGFRVFDFGKEERLWNLEIFDPGAYCKVKVAGPNGASRGLGCDGARNSDFEWVQTYCEVTSSSLFEGNVGYNPNFEDEKLYYQTCCTWTGSECVDNSEFKDGQFVIEQLDAGSITEAYVSNAWSFVDFVGHGNNYVNIQSRFVRVRGIAHHPVKIRPRLTTTDYLVSDTKQGCIKDQNDITYYDFKPDVYTSERIECSYTFKTHGKCDVSYSKGTLSIRDCAEACREDERVMFTMESGECMCAADNCDDFSVTSDKMYHINNNDACGYKFRYQGTCALGEDFTSIVDHKECRDKCHEEGYTSFSMPCKCLSRCAKGVGDDIYHIQSGYTPHDFIEIKTKSCEHYGHKTINSKEVCRNGSLVLGHDYSETSIQKGKSSVSFLERIQQAVIHYDGDSGAYDCPAQDFKWDGEAWMGSLSSVRKLQLSLDRTKFECQHANGDIKSHIEFSDVTYTYPTVSSVSECKEDCKRNFKSFAEVTTVGTFSDLKTQCSKLTHKIRDVIPEICLGKRKSITGSSTQIGCDGARVPSGDYFKGYCEATHTVFMKESQDYNSDYSSIGEYYRTCCKWEDNTCKEKFIPDVCRRPIPSANFGITRPGCDGARLSDGSFSSSHCQGTYGDQNAEQKHYYSTCCVYEDSQCKEKYVDDVKQACMEEDCSHTTPTAIYSGCQPSEEEEFAYTLQAGGNCEYPVLSEDECERAKTELDISYAVSTEASGTKPPGCLYKHGGVFFNTDNPVLACGYGDYRCICRVPISWRKVEKDQTCVCSDRDIGPTYALLETGKRCKWIADPPGTLDSTNYVLFLDPSDPLASADRAQECANRCYAAGYSAFFIKNFLDGRCKCAQDGCIEKLDQFDATSYAISASSERIPLSDWVPYNSMFDINDIYEIRLKEGFYGCSAQTFLKTGSNWKGSSRCMRARVDAPAFFCSPLSCSSYYGSIGYDDSRLEYRYKLPLRLSFNIKKDYAGFTDFGKSVDISMYQSNSTHAAKGCSGGAYSADPSNTECQSCICLKGENRYRSDFVEVKSKTCEDHGYENILVLATCLEALAEIKFDTSNLYAEYFTEFPQYVQTPLGCAKHPGMPFSLVGTGVCSDSTPCVCARRTAVALPLEVSDRYTLETSGTCSGSYEITSRDECLAAAAIFGILKYEDPENNFNHHTSGAKCGVWNTYVHFGSTTTHCSEAYPCICRSDPPPTVFMAGNCEDFGLEDLSKDECSSLQNYVELASGTMPRNKCLYVNGQYYFNRQDFGYSDTPGSDCSNPDLCGSSIYISNCAKSCAIAADKSPETSCGERVPCVCRGKSPVSVGTCPEETSRKFGFSQICYPTAKLSASAEREILQVSSKRKYTFKELGTGMCAPDHDFFFHSRDNPYRITDFKEVPNTEACKNECLNTEGCTGFSFSDTPTFAYRHVVETKDCYYATTGSSIGGSISPNNMLGNGIRQTKRVDAVKCLQICEEHSTRSNTDILSGTLYAAGRRWHLDAGLVKGGCSCDGPSTIFDYGSYNCNGKSMKFSVTQSPTTCVLSTDGCDKPVLLGDGKCKVGIDYRDKTMDECEQLCIDDKHCRAFSWREKNGRPNCRISGRECHYYYRRLSGSDVNTDDRPPLSTAEYGYVTLLVGKMDHLGNNAQTNSPVCRGDCDSGECAAGLTCYERDANYAPPPGCYDTGGFSLSSSTDYCVYDEYMDGEDLKTELLDSTTRASASLLPQVPVGKTCEDNGWHTIWDEQECSNAAGLLYDDVEVDNLLFDTHAAQDYGADRPSGCYYESGALRLNLNTAMFASDSVRRSICRTGWKRYSLGKTNLPGTRYVINRQSTDMKPHNLASSLRPGQEHVFRISDSGSSYTSDHVLRVFESATDNPGWDFLSRIKFCGESCLKMSHNSYSPWSLAPSWKAANNHGSPVTGFMMKQNDGRCYCQGSFSTGDASKKNNIANLVLSQDYDSWIFDHVSKDFLRRGEFPGGYTTCTSLVTGASTAAYFITEPFTTPGTFDDTTGYYRKCGDLCKTSNMYFFILHTVTGWCACFEHAWDTCGNDPFYNSITKTYSRMDMVSGVVQRSRDLHSIHYEILGPKKYRNMHYGKGRYCGAIGETTQLAGTSYGMQEACYELCKSNTSFVLNEDGMCGCQDTSAECDAMSGVTLSERNWIVDVGPGQCTGTSELNVYAKYDVHRDEQIRRCAEVCANKGDWGGFLLPQEGSAVDISSPGKCYCETGTKTNCNLATDLNWQRFHFEMKCAGTSYAFVKFSTCVSLCSDVNCNSFSYSGEECIISESTCPGVHSRVNSRIYEVSNHNTYQQYEVLNENQLSVTPPHMGVELLKLSLIETNAGFKSCSVPFEIISEKSCAELNGETVGSKIACADALVTLGMSVGVDEVYETGEPSGCYFDATDGRGKFNTYTGAVPASSEKQSVCDVPLVKLSKEDCQKYAEEQGYDFVTEDNIAEFDFSCHVEDSSVYWTPFKTEGLCLKNNFPLEVDSEDAYSYDEFTDGRCMESKCEKLQYRWTKRKPVCAYLGKYSHAHQIRVSDEGRNIDSHITECVSRCVDMLAEGSLGQVNTGVHKLIINRWRGSSAATYSNADADNSWTSGCYCLPLDAARFCDENAELRLSTSEIAGSYLGVTALPNNYDNYHSITVTAEIKCNYASVFRSFKKFERSVVTFQSAVDECFKACVTGSLFHMGGIASVGDMNINGFRVEKGTYSNEFKATCDCVEIPQTPEECEVPSSLQTYRFIDYTDYCSEDLDKVSINYDSTQSLAEQCQTICDGKAGCDGFSLYSGNNHDYANYQCLFADRGCALRNSAGDYKWKSYVKEDFQTFKITTRNTLETETSKYTLSSEEVAGSPVNFPKDNFLPQEEEEWYTHLDFTKYSIEPDCTGKEAIFDDECTHAQTLFPEWQVQPCPTGFTQIDDFCQKVEEIPNMECTSQYETDEDIILNLTFTGSNENEDYLVSDGGPVREDPNLVTCTTFKVLKSFSDHPLNIRNSNGEDVAENLMGTTTLTLQPGIYTYYCVSHPNFMFGSIQVNDCSPSPLFTEVSGNCAQECSRLAYKGSLGYFFQDEKYILTHYASDCKCHLTKVTGECSQENNTKPSDTSLYKIMTTRVNSCINDIEMICKDAPEDKLNTEEYMCVSDEELNVFDSGDNCAICGGGTYFDVGSVFFNEIGNTQSCVYAEETGVCDERSPGWSQYQVRIPFDSYSKDGERGYCEGFKDMQLDFSGIILSEMIESCATACKAYDEFPAFSLSRTFCYCTTVTCGARIGSSDTFVYTEGEAPAETVDIVQKWNSNAPGLRCFKDLSHSDEAPCDWIRALKHFARGGSYRIGDCHNLAPGTDIETQIPCNGHGFPSAGVCACDYAENFELRSSGVGLTFEAPNLRQTPFRGKACELMCPGYDMFNMDSVCSGHGRCETDGRCSCEQGYTGYNCHLACETEAKALTCSGHGVCNEREQPLRRDIVEALNDLECKNDTLYLARDRVIRTGDVIQYMYKSLDGLSIDSFIIPNLITVDFKSSNTTYKISVDGSEDQDNPVITVCQTFTVVKSFSGEPFNIIKNTGEMLAYNWDAPQQETFTPEPGRYEYMSVNSPLTHRGFIDVVDCTGKSTRTASIDDFYIRGESVRRPFNSISNFPYMPCKDRMNITRETAYHPLIEHTTLNITVECSLLPGYQDEAYTLTCGVCQCEESQATGFWSGYDCRTPAEGYFGNDGRDACPGLTADKKPCNGGGTCTWGSIDGLGESTYADAQCFCGDTTLESTYATAPRNLDGDMMFHIMNFDDALYVDTLDIVDGNETERTCFHGTVPIGFQECQHDWVSDGGVETIISEAAIVTDIRNDIVFDFDSSCDLPGTLFDQVSTEELLLVGNKREQKMKCAGACFGEYKFSFDGRCPPGGVIVLTKDTNPGATWGEKSMYCSEACRTKVLPVVGEWSNTANPGFSIKQNGECSCDTEVECAQIISDEWKHFDFVAPSIFRHTGSVQGKEFEVGPPTGDSDSERLEWCASKCQHFVFDDQSIAKGFLYTSLTPTSCVCQAGSGSDILDDGRDRYDYTHFKGFTVNYGVSCKCEIEESCTAGSGDGDRFKILGDVHPKLYTLEQRVSVFDGDFICLKEDIIQCKAGPLELTNYNQGDCSCKFGFTGNTCETPRMMCIFSGQETDGTSCICSGSDGEINIKVRSSGCCTNGLYWDQIRYSSFSPLVDFDVVPDNIFYYDALKSVCKPGPMKLKSVSEGADAVRVHNYAALTDEIYIRDSATCNFPKEIHIYKAVFRYNGLASDDSTMTITKEEIRALGYKYDNLFDKYVEEYARDRCLHRCTHRKVDENPFKSFHLRKTRTNLEEDTMYRGDREDILRTFDGSNHAGHKNPGNLDNNAVEENEIEFCRQSCVSDLQSADPRWHNSEFRSKGYIPSHFAVDRLGRCYCFAPLGGNIDTENYGSYSRFSMTPDIEYDCTCSTKPAFVGGNNDNSYVEPIFTKDQKVYDIVYPMDKTSVNQNIDCFDAHVNLKHVDIQAETDANLMTGLPSTITPAQLNILGDRVKKDDVTNFHDCYKACHAETNQIVANSFLWGRRPQIPITFAGSPVSPYTKLKHCWSHCNSDSDCEPDLKCVTRFKDSERVYAWPGCIEPPSEDQVWGSGDTITNEDNICYDVKSLDDECYCTVHDPDAPPCSNSFDLMGAGFCQNIKYLRIGIYPPVLAEGEPNYDADKRRECMNRCLADYPDSKAFFTKTVDNEDRCACAEDYCAERSGSSPYSSYLIDFCDTNTRPGFLMEEHTDYFKISRPKLIVANDVEYDEAMPVNPYTCGLESSVHQGDIVSSSCTCPINDFEEVFVEYEYKELTQRGTCMSYYTLAGDLTACEASCDAQYGCKSFSHDGSTCSFAVDCDKDWDVREFAPFFCYGPSSSSHTSVSAASTAEKCAENTGSFQFGWSADIQLCYKYTNTYINMDDCTDLDGIAFSTSHNLEPTLSGGSYTATASRASITQILQGKMRNDWYYGNLGYKSYAVLQTPGYDISDDKRYVKQVIADTKDFYCTVGEEVVYTLDVSDTFANDHSCMQKCREEYPDLEFVIARGETKGDIFNCLCSDFNPGDSACGIGTPNTFNGGKQYKVSNTPTSSCKCPGFYIFDGQSISCPSGRYSGEDDPCMSSCKLCPRGRFSEVGKTQCESCPAGKIQEGLSCTDCAAGQSSPAGVDQCFVCALGLYTDRKGIPSCFDCPNGYYDDNALEGSSCKICPKGYYSGLATKSDCSECQIGRYGDSIGMSGCKLCSSGKYQPSTKKTSASDCVNCAAGKYQNQIGMSSCKNCPTGQYQSQTGRTGCINCQVGKYSSQTGRSGCSACSRGKYQSQVGQSSCISCRVGLYSDQTGRTSCKACGRGKYNDQNGQDSSSDCHNCPSGQYNGQNGQSGCTSCGNKYNGYLWSNNPDRTTYDESCDSHKINHPSKAKMYYDDDYYCNFAGQMAGHTGGRGDMWRRDCWMDPFKWAHGSNACNDYACKYYSDCSQSWDTYYPSGYNIWYYCEASHDQQYD